MVNKDPLTWDDLAEEYDKRNSGRPARTLPMDTVAKWAKDSGLFIIHDDMFYRKES